jgi:hypothetical protein
MLLLGCQPENTVAASLGVASHNVFDLSFALLARASVGSETHVGFELLEGMADPLRTVLTKLRADVRVYMPVVEEDAFSTRSTHTAPLRSPKNRRLGPAFRDPPISADWVLPTSGTWDG